VDQRHTRHFLLGATKPLVKMIRFTRDTFCRTTQKLVEDDSLQSRHPFRTTDKLVENVKLQSRHKEAQETGP
jgi:hypothetical protein